MTCSLKVNTHSEGWHNSLVKVFQNIQDISYSIDAQQGIAQISGNIDPNKILMLLAKAGKHAELCRIDSGYKKRDLPIVPAKGHDGKLAPSKGHDYGYNAQYGTLVPSNDYGYNPQYGTLDHYRDNPKYGTLVPSNGHDYGDNPPYCTLDYYLDNPKQRNGYAHQHHWQHHQHSEPPPQYLPQPLPPPPGNMNIVESPCRIM